MADQPIRVYADTSVYGGVFDEEFADSSARFFDQVRGGGFSLVASALVDAEIEQAPMQVVQFFHEMLYYSEILDVSDEALNLSRAYVSAGIVTRASSEDALHVALATVARCTIIVSWNFKHIVHFEKIGRYNHVNECNGYSRLAIHSPIEVIAHEDREEF